MSRTVRLVGRLDHASMDAMVGDLARWERQEGRATVDLAGLTFVTPVVIAALGASVDVVRRTDAVSVVPPQDPDVAAYVRRMDVLPPDVAGPDTGRRNEAGGFCGVQRFLDDDTYAAAASRLTRAIAIAARVDEPTEGALRLCLDEILENVVHHAASPTGGVAVCQTWAKRQRAEVVILDRGRGVRASLAASTTARTPGSDADALRDALTLGVTATPERNAGMGLAFSSSLVLANGGDIELRSGNAVVAASAPRQDRTVPTDLAGTAVRVTIRTDAPLNAAAAYATLDDLP